MQSLFEDLWSSFGMHRVAGTRCRDIRGRLSAFQDGELSPSETARVAEHIDRCPNCAFRLQRLEAVVPHPSIEVPPEVLRTMHGALDQAMSVEFGRLRALGVPDRPAPSGWLTTPLQVPRIAIVAYAALLVAALGWGLSNGLSSGPGVESTSLASAPLPPSPGYKPASFVPTDDWF